MSDWLPSLNALRAFEAVSRHLSYRTAAEELRVTPAAVKQLVSKLEAALGEKLVRRSGRGIELTARGKAGATDLNAAMQFIAASVRKLRAQDREVRLIVSVESSFATAWLVPRLQEFRARYPQITVLIDSSQAIVDIERGGIDVAIRYGVTSKGDLIIHRLFDDRVFPACSPSLAKGPPVMEKLADLRAVPLIHWDISQLEWAASTRKWFSWDSWLRHIGQRELATAQGLHFNEYGQAVQAAIAGQGMLLASWPILREPFESGLLVAPFAESVATDIGYDVVTTPAACTKPEVTSFIDWLLAAAQREQKSE